MRTRMIGPPPQARYLANQAWLDLEQLAELEISSQDTEHPIECALLDEPGAGWRAAEPGKQIIRLLFAPPRNVHRIRLEFLESAMERTQEYVVRWSSDGGESLREILRQQWNFSPVSSPCEIEDYRVELIGLTVLELIIDPDIGGRAAFASLVQLRLA
jgi:hypothetical protein